MELVVLLGRTTKYQVLLPSYFIFIFLILKMSTSPVLPVIPPLFPSLQLYFVQLEASNDKPFSHVTKLNLLLAVNQTLYELQNNKNKSPASDWSKDSNTNQSSFEKARRGGGKEYIGGFILAVVGGLCLMVVVSFGVMLVMLVCGRKQRKWVACKWKQEEEEGGDGARVEDVDGVNLKREMQQGGHFQLCNRKQFFKKKQQKQHFTRNHKKTKEGFCNNVLRFNNNINNKKNNNNNNNISINNNNNNNNNKRSIFNNNKRGFHNNNNHHHHNVPHTDPTSPHLYHQQQQQPKYKFDNSPLYTNYSFHQKQQQKQNQQQHHQQHHYKQHQHQQPQHQHQHQQQQLQHQHQHQQQHQHQHQHQQQFPPNFSESCHGNEVLSLIFKLHSNNTNFIYSLFKYFSFFKRFLIS